MSGDEPAGGSDYRTHCRGALWKDLRPEAVTSDYLRTPNSGLRTPNKFVTCATRMLYSYSSELSRQINKSYIAYEYNF
eukprot:scaffold30353_cov27-Prasinocladus_malaysianus.AAC.1